MFPTVGTRRSQGIRGEEGAGCGVSASHLTHLIVLSRLTVVPLGLRLPLRLPLALPLAPMPAVASVPSVAAVAVLVGVWVLRLVLHLGASVLLRSSPLQSACRGKGELVKRHTVRSMAQSKQKRSNLMSLFF